VASSGLHRGSSLEDVNQRKQIEEKLTSGLGALVAVHEAGRILSSTLSLDEIGTRLLNIAQRITALTAAVISLADEHGRLRELHALGPEGLRRVASSTPEAQVARRRALKTQERQAFGLAPPAVGGTSLVGLCLPLVIRNRLTGMLEVYGPEALGEKAKVEILESITRQAASAFENARLHRELAEREHLLEDLAGRLLEVRKEERRRLAQDIHDGLVQVALAAHQNLQTYADDHPPESPLSRQNLDQALGLVKQTVEEARHVIASLRPTALDDLGLAAALQSQVDSLRAEGWEVGYDEDLWEEHLSAEIETSLYAIAREALTNVRKHARTNRVHVTLTQLGGRVCLKIRDWGCGFDGTTPPERDDVPGEQLGLRGMRERVSLLGGEFTIHSRQGAGTSVVAEIPLAHATPTGGQQIPGLQCKVSPIRLIVADDHALVREGFRSMLASEPDFEVVGEAKNGREALELCCRLRPDLVLMDARMPEMDGLAATQAIKTEHPATHILMLSAYEKPDYMLEAVRAGATGYVIKDATKHDLIGAMREVLSGKHPLDRELAMQLLHTLGGEDEQEPAVPRRSGKQAEALPEPLTPRELEVLRLMAQGLTNRQISQKLVVSAATVKVHVEHIIEKLEVSDRTQAAVWASEAGLLEPTE
jgi:DNA-binding NarL/FixJ family response regulator/signal transduction histidine kinase